RRGRTVRAWRPFRCAGPHNGPEHGSVVRSDNQGVRKGHRIRGHSYRFLIRRISDSANIPTVAGNGSFDVLVIGSGASGLAAAVSAEHADARVAPATQGSIHACNSAPAPGGMPAALE